MSNDLEVPFDRVTYREGQLLAALDLQDDKRRNDRLRWMHVRYLHDTWGIALGFEVRKKADGAAVIVGPGYAVDSRGRDILLSSAMEIPVPSLAGPATIVLMVSFQDDAKFRQLPDALMCPLTGLNPRADRPLLFWKAAEEVRLGLEVPLVALQIENDRIHGDLISRVRRKARRLVRPHLGLGTTEPGKTGWRNVMTPPQQLSVLEVTVDTTEAGFSRVPYYFASLAGDFSGIIVAPEGPGVEPWPVGSFPAFFNVPFGFITDETASGFTFRILPARGFPVGVPTVSEQAEAHEWTISWLGIEPVLGCAPILDLRRVFLGSGQLSAGLVELINGEVGS
jgi:hypothetical protein